MSSSGNEEQWQDVYIYSQNQWPARISDQDRYTILTRQILQKVNISVSFNPHQTLRQLQVKDKDAVNKESLSNVVYKVPCKDCDSMFVGQTKGCLVLGLRNIKKLFQQVTVRLLHWQNMQWWYRLDQQHCIGLMPVLTSTSIVRVEWSQQRAGISSILQSLVTGQWDYCYVNINHSEYNYTLNWLSPQFHTQLCYSAVPKPLLNNVNLIISDSSVHGKVVDVIHVAPPTGLRVSKPVL